MHTRHLLGRQHTQKTNPLWGHLAERGGVAPDGRSWISQFAPVLKKGDCGLPEAVVNLGRLLLGPFNKLD